MNCSLAEKVSMLIDGELSEPESLQVRAHIAGCAECRNLEKDFLFFREQIKESAADFVAGQTRAPIFLCKTTYVLEERNFSARARFCGLYFNCGRFEHLVNRFRI